MKVLLGELAVAGEAGDAEVPTAVLGLVGDVLGGETFDEGDHAGDVFGGAGDVFGALDVEGVHVFEEGALVLGGVLGDGLAGGGGVADDLVVDVGDVHDVVQGEAVEAGGAAQQVDVEEGAEVADVAVVVDGGAAAVEAQDVAVGGEERFDFTGESVEEFECHASPIAAGRDACAPHRRLLSAVVYTLLILAELEPSAEAKLGCGFERVGGEVPGEELGEGGGGDHGGVIGGESDGWEGDGEVAAGGFGSDVAAEFAVGGDASADEEAADAVVLGCMEGGAGEILDDRVLEAGDEVEGWRVEVRERAGEVHGVGLCFVQADGAEGIVAGCDRGLHVVQFDVTADGGFDAGEGHVEAGGIVVGLEGGFSGELGGGVAGGLLFDLREGKEAGVGGSEGGEGVDPGAAGVGEAEELGDLVEGLAGGVVEGLAYVAVVPRLFGRLGGEVEVGVAAADDEGEEWGGVGEGRGCVHENGVDVAFEVVDGDEREVGAEGQGLGEADADEQGSGEAWAFGDGDGGEIGVGDVGTLHGLADDGDDGAEVLAGG